MTTMTIVVRETVHFTRLYFSLDACYIRRDVWDNGLA